MAAVETTFNYWLPDSQGGFGREIHPGTSEIYTKKFDVASAKVNDVRGNEGDFSLDRNGFEFHQHESVEKDFDDEARVKDVVYKEIDQLLKDKTGATRVHPFSHIIRRSNFEDIEDKAKKQGPLDGVGGIPAARYTHVDQSYEGAERVLEDNMGSEAEKLGKTRWGIINVWRPITPVRRDPFAMCDWNSIDEADLVGVEAVLPSKGSGTFENVSKRGFQIWAGKSNPNHRWYYASNMMPEEVYFVKCFDSRKDVARLTLHSAFVDPKTKDVPGARESIEVRCLVFWEDQERD